MILTIVSSSIRKERKSHKVAQLLYKVAESKGITVKMVDLQSIDLPEYGKELSEEDLQLKAQLESDLNETDKFIFVSPEYNGFFTSALKSFTDYFSNGPFKNKRIGVATATTGAMGGMRAAQMMQLQILGLFGLTMPNVLLTGLIDQKIDNDIKVLDPVYESKVNDFIDQVIA